MKSNKGISLIVLVITIIVMIILAGSIILSLSNNGIIGKASDAVDKSNDANIRSIVQTYWAEAYAEANVESKPITKEHLRARVFEKIEANNLDVSDYVINVKTSGITVVRGWKQEGLTVRKGDIKLTIGDYIDYDDGVSSYTGKWQILGASEDGELLILSEDEISNYSVDSVDLEVYQKAWLTAETDLNNMCNPYGKGKNAIGARSITAEDVDKITGFEKQSFAGGRICEYGNDITVFYSGTTVPKYESYGSNGFLYKHDKGFYYYNGNDIVKVNLLNGEIDKPITTIKLNAYEYYVEETTAVNSTDKAYGMLFRGSYHLASSYVYSYGDLFKYGVMKVDEDGVWSYSTGDDVDTGVYFFTSTGDIGDFVSGGVRAVVILSPSINPTNPTGELWVY